MAGLPVITLDALDCVNNDSKIAIIITTRLYWKEIAEQLMLKGFGDSNIFHFGKFQDEFADKQYFDLEYLDKNSQENLADVGAFDGRTSVNFYNYYGENVNMVGCLN